MKFLKIILAILAVNLLNMPVSAQKLSGTVFEITDKGEQALPGVNIYWAGTTVGTVSDLDGKYKIKRPEHAHQLVFSFVGFESDTIHAPPIIQINTII